MSADLPGERGGTFAQSMGQLPTTRAARGGLPQPITRSHGAQIITIPSSDAAFRKYVESLAQDTSLARPEDLEARLRRVFPTVVVRERALSAEPLSWYVYRDGGWRPPDTGPWWEAPDLPAITLSDGGWITAANATALGMLGLEAADIGARHFTDFIVPGTLDDALNLFRIIEAGNDLTATVLLRPTSGDVIAVDLRAGRRGSDITGVLRLARDIAPEIDGPVVAFPELTCLPETDVAFRRYAELALARMPEPSAEGFVLRLRRLYPHARVVEDGNAWTAFRDAQNLAGAEAGWWQDAELPCVRYDAQALILEANEAAARLLGSPLVGHYWQEFVTPGSTEQVSAMLAILAEVGAAESRFRIPAADGSLVEFDSYTRVEGDTFTTVMRPRG